MAKTPKSPGRGRARPRTVIVDANAIVQRSWRLDSAAWRILLYQAKCQSIKLVVPEIVVREAVGRYSGELAKRLAAAASAAQEVEDLTRVPVEIPGAVAGLLRLARRISTPTPTLVPCRRL